MEGFLFEIKFMFFLIDSNSSPKWLRYTIKRTQINKHRVKSVWEVKVNKKADADRRNSGTVLKFVGVRWEAGTSQRRVPSMWIIHALVPRPSARRYVRRCYFHQPDLVFAENTDK